MKQETAGLVLFVTTKKQKHMNPKDSMQNAKDFPLVCVGGSAGGLDAYTRLLQNLPADMGVAIVMHEILPRYTTMPVELITEKLDIRPNHVFIIPSQRDLHVLHDEFRLKPISKPRGWPDVITVFLRSITKHWEGKLIAVIVSGYDGDGAEALCGIKEVGGITIAQKPATAKQPDMPESAIASGWPAITRSRSTAQISPVVCTSTESNRDRSSRRAN